MRQRLYGERFQACGRAAWSARLAAAADVMRPRKKLVLALVFAVALSTPLLFVLTHQAVKAPTVSFVSPGYSKGGTNRQNVFLPGDWIRAQASLKNNGNMSIDCARNGFVEAQTAGRWTNGFCLQAGGYGFLQPGSKVNLTAFLPTGTVRWRYSFKVRMPSVRERAEDTLMKTHQLNAIRSVAWVLNPLPSKSGPDVEVKSEWFEIGAASNSPLQFKPPQPADAAPGR
jgi:hypothetical protein